ASGCHALASVAIAAGRRLWRGPGLAAAGVGLSHPGGNGQLRFGRRGHRGCDGCAGQGPTRRGRMRRWLAREIRLLLIALQFLTRVSIPAWVGYEPAWLQTCARYYPVVGALIGLCGALVLAAAASWWPPAVAVVLSMAFTVWLTG